MPLATVDLQPDAAFDHEILMAEARYVSLGFDLESDVLQSQADDRLVA